MTSVHTRIGDVVAANGDYTASQILFDPPDGMTSDDVQAAIEELFASGNGFTREEIEDFLSEDFEPGYDTEIEYDDVANRFIWHRLSRLSEDVDEATITIDLDRDVGRLHDVTIDDDRDCQVVNAVAGKFFDHRVTQGTGGNHTISYLFPITWEEGFTPVQTPVEGKSDLFHFYIESVDAYGVPTCRAWVETTERPQPLEMSASITGAAATVETTTEGSGSSWSEKLFLCAINEGGSDHTCTFNKFGDVTGGTFDLSTPGGDLLNIPYNVTAEELIQLLADEFDDGVPVAVTPIAHDDDPPYDHNFVSCGFWGGTSGAGSWSIDSTNLTGGGSYSISGNSGGHSTGNLPTGTWRARLTGGTYSAAIAVSASEATIQSALEACPEIGAGNISVTRHYSLQGGLGQGLIEIEFIGELAGTDVADLEVDNASMTDGYLEVRPQLNGSGDSTNEVHTITVTGSPSAGSFVLTILGFDVTIPFDSTAGESEALIIAAVGGGNVDVTGDLPDDPQAIEFTGDYAGTNVAASSIDDSELSGAGMIRWAETDFPTITLEPGDGEYVIRHVDLIPGKTIVLEVISDNAEGTFEWDDGDAPVTWLGSPPTVPADGDSVFITFHCRSLSKIIGKVW